MGFVALTLILLLRVLFLSGVRTAAGRARDDAPRPRATVCAAADKYPPHIGRAYPGDAHPTDKQQQWAMATCAQLFSLNGDSHDVIGGETNRVDEERQSLRRWWGIEDRDSLLSALAGLEAGGHRRHYDEWVQWIDAQSPRELRRLTRQVARDPTASNSLDVVQATRARFAATSLAGWDYSRYVALCRWGVRAGYLREEEAWTRIMPVARLLQRTFASWDELGANYLEGRRFWSLRQTAEDTDRLAAHQRFHRWNRYAPWRRLPWSLNLLPEQPRDDGSAEFRLGRAHFYCFGDPDGDAAAGKEAGVRLFHAAAAKGNVDAMYLLGACYADGEGVAKDPHEAYAWYRRAAGLGDAPSQYELGMLHYWGRGVARDRRQAASWVFQAMTNGAGARADAFVGWCYEEGVGVPACITNAVAFHRRAAEQGEAWAQANLGDCYLTGNGVPRDPQTAARWFSESARGQHSYGMYRWGQSLESGHAGPTNRSAALVWYRRAAAEGSGEAKKRLAELDGRE